MATDKKQQSKKGPSSKKQIYLVDDHPIVRQGLIKLIEQEDGLEVCGEAGSVTAALEAIKASGPDVVLVDISLEESNGLELIKAIDDLGLQIPMLVLSMHDEALYAEHALRSGASGYVMKQAASNTLIHAIEKVLDGEIYVSKTMSSQMLKMAFKSGDDTRSGTESLSIRELEVFELIGRPFDARDCGAAPPQRQNHRNLPRPHQGKAAAAQRYRIDEACHSLGGKRVARHLIIHNG